jgi:putative SOS response-associated peptidase YedK
VRHKPAFRHAFRARRALVFADLFYEWQVVPGQRVKQPWCLRLSDERPFAFAALWERWHDPAARDAPPLETFTLITTRPNAALERIHDRMPVMLAPADYARWLDLSRAADDAEALLAPFDAAPMTATAVGTRVNNPRYDAPDCLAPLAGGSV